MSGGAQAAQGPLTGTRMLLAALAIGIGNFLVVLDTTIANVSVPTIAGSLGVSSEQGTWVITSYAVAEAITVPLTGWLSSRFGTQRVFLACYFGFAFLSLLCGLSQSLSMLIFCRVLLGLCGGPIMPLAQTMLMQLLPPEKQTLGTVMWAMTTLIGPVVGPVLGGTLCDNAGWQWIFFIGTPVAIAGGAVLLTTLAGRKDVTQKVRIDSVGLGLLIIWVGALQIMLDEGRNKDWFASTEICVLAVVAAIGFVCFLIWELTETQPIVDLRVFRHRGYTFTVMVYAVGFAAFFAQLVILPLWLQQNLGYTATTAGYATGVLGLLAVLSAPIIGTLVEKIDPRPVIFTGLVGLALIALWRTAYSPDVTFMQVAVPTLCMGPFMVMFFIPTIGLAVANVNADEQANAAGLSNFLRTLAGAFATSLVQTQWDNQAEHQQTLLSGAIANGGAAFNALLDGGMARDSAVSVLNGLVQGQAVMQATLHVFGTVAVVFLVAAGLIWFVPRPKGPINTAVGH